MVMMMVMVGDDNLMVVCYVWDDGGDDGDGWVLSMIVCDVWNGGGDDGDGWGLSMIVC